MNLLGRVNKGDDVCGACMYECVHHLTLKAILFFMTFKDFVCQENGRDVDSLNDKIKLVEF